MSTFMTYLSSEDGPLCWNRGLIFFYQPLNFPRFLVPLGSWSVDFREGRQPGKHFHGVRRRSLQNEVGWSQRGALQWAPAGRPGGSENGYI